MCDIQAHTDHRCSVDRSTDWWKTAVVYQIYPRSSQTAMATALHIPGSRRTWITC